jgi:23S rRNA (cytidine1920-2'-O)/16S rRNA (cytidine1409-2'-O)-methyltransferase
VRVNGFPVRNARAMVADEARVTVEDDAPLRGTLKLRAALARFGVQASGKTAVDLGASTGGFTVALLEAGAARVYAVDAGHGQLLGSLRVDPRVVNMERTNLGALVLPEAVGLITIDLAYLSLARAAPQIAERVPMTPDAEVIALVKPMFELGLANAPTDDASLHAAIAHAAEGFAANGFTVVADMESPVAGGHGTREGFLHLRR